MKAYKIHVRLTLSGERPLDKILEHADKLGYSNKNPTLRGIPIIYLYFNQNGTIDGGTDETKFKTLPYTEITFNEFLNIKPPKKLPKGVTYGDGCPNYADLIETFKLIAHKNPGVVLTGSLALHLQDFELGRNAKDLDFVLPAGTQIWLPAGAIPTKHDDPIGDIIHQCELNGIQIEFKTMVPNARVVEDAGFKIMHIDSIMERKLHYLKELSEADKDRRLKHQGDLLKYYQSKINGRLAKKNKTLAVEMLNLSNELTVLWNKVGFADKLKIDAFIAACQRCFEVGTIDVFEEVKRYLNEGKKDPKADK